MMASISRPVHYPTGDGKPMAETDLHRGVLVDLIECLTDHFVDDPNVYVSGDLLMFYEAGNGRRHLAPDVFVVIGVPNHRRDNYLIWDEGKGPDFVVEVTSKTTRKEDEGKQRGLYRDVLRVPEYFQFDPTADYLRPPFQGHRLVDGEYLPIEPVDGRLPSLMIGLHLEARGTTLRLFNPATGRRLPTRLEQIAEARTVAAQASEVARHQYEAASDAAEAARRASEEAKAEIGAELDRLRREVEALRRSSGNGNGNGAAK